MACSSVVGAGASFLYHFNLNNLGGRCSSSWRHQRSSSSLTSTSRGSKYSLQTPKTLSSLSSLAKTERISGTKGVLPWLFLSSSEETVRGVPWLLHYFHSKEEEEKSCDRYRYRYLYDFTQQKITHRMHLSKDMKNHYIIGFSEGFLLTIDFDTTDIYATNPFTGSHLILPSTASLPNVIGILRSSNSDKITHYIIRQEHDNDPNIQLYHYQGKCKCRCTKGSSFLFQKIDPTRTVEVGEIYYDFYRKAILSPSLDTVVVIYGLGDDEEEEEEGHLAFAPLITPPPSSWTPLPKSSNSPSAARFVDIIFHQDRLHALDSHGALTIFDVHNPSAPPLFWPPPAEYPSLESMEDEEEDVGNMVMYLVDSPDGHDLFLVYRWIQTDCDPPKTKTFKVCKLDKMMNNCCCKWERVETIGDLVFFLGCNRSFSLSARDFSPALLKPNSIYFTDIWYVDSYENIDDTGVFHLEDGSFHFYPIENGHHKYNEALPVWLTPPATFSS